MTQHKKTSATRYTAAEWKMRRDLAACYRVADLFGFSDIVWNHITAKIPDSENFLISRLGALFHGLYRDVDFSKRGNENYGRAGILPLN